MPTFTIFTNQPSIKVPAGFLKEATDLIADQLGKPASFICVRLHTDQFMSFGGSEEPCAIVDLFSSGKLGPEMNDGHSAVIGQFIEAKLGIPLNRFYINYYDVERSNVGWNGKTFAN